MANNKENEWLKEFNEFASTEGHSVPDGISINILNRVRKQLNPSAWVVFFKLLFIHSIVGTFSLGVCDQFGMSPFQTEFSLSEYFMKYGHSFCMTMCGILFVSLSVLFASLLLRQEELKILYRNSLLQIFSLAIFSLVLFFLLGADVTISIGFFWLSGAMLGGMLSSLSFRKSKSPAQA
ncbi:MAG: hypothetical protein ABL927_07555 [Bdellovibrionales bacterium]